VLPVTAITPEALVHAAPIVRLDEARKLVAMAHRDEPLQGTSAIRRVAADAARAVTMVPALQMIERHASAVDPFVKYLFETNDAYRVETVRIPLERTGRFSVCVSSQVGCAMACSFCATGRLGLARNLAAWEIVEQVRTVRRELTSETLGRVHGVVFQGMGEPMANLDAVLDAIAVFSEPSALGIDSRNITVCTSGLPNGIRRLAQKAPKVRLGWSVGSGRSDVRRSIMPVANAHSDDDVFDAMVEHARTTGLSPMWAVTLLAGVNDTDDDAAALAARVHAFAAATDVRPRLSVLAYNPIGADDPFARASDAAMARFREVLASHGLGSHRRYSGGSDIGAACGQLAATA